MSLSLPLCLPVPKATSKSKFPLVIMEGQADVSAPDFCRFHQHYCLSGGELRDALRRLEHVLRCFAVPVALVSGERLVGLVQSGALEVRGHGGGVGGLGKHGSRLSALESRLLLTLENHEEVSEVVERPGRRYRGVGGREAAAVRIQACWRRHRDRSAYVEQRRRRWAEGTIAIAWLMHAQLGRVRRALQARRLRSLQNCRQRAKVSAMPTTATRVYPELFCHCIVASASVCLFLSLCHCVQWSQGHPLLQS